VGAARFVRGLVRIIDPRRLVVVVNTGDDEDFYGLHVSPDIDTITYTLAGVAARKTGWGIEGDTTATLRALERFYGPAWFTIGDRDFATHIFRTAQINRGVPLSEVTAEIARGYGVRATVIPMSNDPVRTFVKLKGRAAIPFQQYFVRGRAQGAIERIELRGASRARPAPGVLDAIRNSSAVILAPSNPFVSLGPILELKGVRETLRKVRNRVAAISPIVGGRTIKGPADKMLRALGHDVSPLGVARLYRDIAGVFVLDRADREYAEAIRALGMHPVVADTIMTTPGRAAHLAAVVLRAVRVYA
jgi:LPPG:FO 2-phospho-L-lactate transferase